MEKKTINSFRDLEVWQLGMDIAEKLYHVTKKFPNSERFSLTDQMRRAAIAIPSNIAEGQARHHLKEYMQFLYIALSSGAELDTQLELSYRFGYINQGEFKELHEQINILGRKLRRLIQNLKPITYNP